MKIEVNSCNETRLLVVMLKNVIYLVQAGVFYTHSAAVVLSFSTVASRQLIL